MSISIRPVALIAAAVIAGSASAQPAAVQQKPVWADKPDIAAFEKMEDARLAGAQKAIDRIVAASGPRTIGNTLAPYDEAMRQLNAASYLAGLVRDVHPDEKFRDHATAMATKVSSAATALSLNPAVYHALENLDLSKADAATHYYVSRQLLEYRLAGVDKDDATRAKLRRFQDQLNEDQSMFERNISDDQSSIEIDGAAELDGLPRDYLERHKPGTDGKIRISTNYPDLFPVLEYAKSDAVRRRLWEAWTSRAYPRNKVVLRDMMQLRYDIANLLGFESWADYNAADKMIRSGPNIALFIADLDATTRPVAVRENALLLAEKRKTQPDAAQIFSYEGFRLSELVRRSQFDFDSESVRPYFPYARVEQGILDTAAALFHVRFRREADAPAWDASVETWDVLEGKTMIGRFYLDMHPRPGKYSHAQMSPILDGIRGIQLPEAILECNFPEPTSTDPGLMSYGDVETFFHEFGHLMHHILGGQQPWAGISGISMESDFVEAPSQMLEEWIRSPQVLASFARHYQTGEPIPAELVARMNRASAFGRANFVMGQNAFSAVSYDIYKDPPQDIDLDALYLRDVRKHSLRVPLESDAHFYASFNHLAGYSSAYYTYMWDKEIAEDFFGQFDHADLLRGDAPMRYRRVVLEPGGSESANDLVKNFLGRPQQMASFQHWMEEEFSIVPAK